MSKNNDSHDLLFKKVFGEPEYAVDLIKSYIPSEVVRSLDLSTLQVVSNSFIDEELKGSSADLLFQVNLLNDKSDFKTGHQQSLKQAHKPSPRQVYIYMLFEHKSFNDHLVTFQLLKYMVRIWESHTKGDKTVKKLPIILPIVFYHGKYKWRVYFY